MRQITSNVDPDSELENDHDTLQRVMQDLKEPKDGKLESFAPVVASILKDIASRKPAAEQGATAPG